MPLAAALIAGQRLKADGLIIRCSDMSERAVLALQAEEQFSQTLPKKQKKRTNFFLIKRINK
jgi:hypothetical protein